jgi:hypothetical protein
MVRMSITTPDQPAEQILTERLVALATSRLQQARDQERADRDIQVAREFALTAKLVLALAE